MELSYSVENLRRIQTMPLVRLKPITILIGRNSAGKSTFLRSIPLLAQSRVTRSSAPILWFGDYVDFGDFKTAVCKNSTTGHIAFSFKIDGLQSLTTFPHRRRSRANITSNEVIVKYYVGSDADQTVLKKITLATTQEDSPLDIEINFESEKAELIVDGENIFKNLTRYKIYNRSNDLFSPVRYFDEANSHISNIERLVIKVLSSLIDSRISNRVSDTTVLEEAYSIMRMRTFNAQTLSIKSEYSKTQTFTKFYVELANELNQPFGNSVQTLRKAYRAIATLDLVDEVLINYISNSNYLSAGRARSERFYRRQELEISEISPNGNNLPMFLASLTRTRLLQFSTWVNEVFGFEVKLSNSGGHTSIILTDGKSEVNVSDTGYGVSQVLPVLAQIWWATIQSRYNSNALRQSYFSRKISELIPKTLVIEQPEADLHPAHQALLADVFSKAISEASKANVNLLVETHSEAMINRLGELIEEGIIHANDVEIVIFDTEDILFSPPNVTVSNFNEDGVLNNWPFGFFNYSK